MILQLLLLSFPLLAFADAGIQLPETMSNVMYIPNVNDTLDSDDDGIPAWRELKSVIDSIAGVLGQSCYTCSLETRYLYNDLNFPQTTSLEVMSGFLDTNSLWTPYTGVTGSITAGDDYILTKLAQCARSAAALTGVTPKYFCFGPGVPRWIKPYSELTASGDWYMTDPVSGANVGNGDYDSTVAKSMCDFVEIYYRPDIDTVWETDVLFSGYWGSRYIEAARGASKKGFTPGVYRQYKANGGNASDSTLQYVICTQIDGFDDNDICNMVRKAYAGRYAAWEPDGTPNYWAVVDGGESQDNDMFAATNGSYSYNFATWTDAREAFTSSQILWDNRHPLIDTSSVFAPADTFFVTPGSIPDTMTAYFGYSTYQTLPVGDSAVFYYTPASYHAEGYNIPTDICYQTDIAMASGAFVIIPESWDAWTIRDTTFRSGTSDDQTLMVEWFDNTGLNATYGVGHTREVSTGNTATKETYIIDAMFTPEAPFAVIAELATQKKAQTIRMGWPSFAWRQAEQAVGSSASFVGSCDEVFSYSATSPADADSYYVELTYDNDSTSTLRFDTSPSSAVSYSIGTRWISKGLSGVMFIYKDTDGNLHPEPVYEP